MTLKVVLINGPAGCGKDTLAALARNKWGGEIDRMSAPLKEAYLALVPGADLTSRSEKESHRAHLIALSEEFVKPRFGKAWFGECLLKRLPESGVVWVPDSRFKEEAIPLLDIAGLEVGIIRVVRDTSVWPKHDSGHYLNLNGISTWNVHNSDMPDKMLDRLVSAGFEDWLLAQPNPEPTALSSDEA